MEKHLFEFTRTDYLYKGIFFGELDHLDINKQMGNVIPEIYLEAFNTGVMGSIWVDEKGIWHSKVMVRYPSGSTTILGKDYDYAAEKGIKINETYILQHIYQIPMKNKKWYPNPSGDIEGILNIMAKNDMINSFVIQNNDIDTESFS